MVNYVVFPLKKNNIHHFLNRPYINSYYVPVAYILYLRNPRVYSNSPSILGCFTDSLLFLDFFLRDVILAGCCIFITSRSFQNCPSLRSGQLRRQKSLGPLKKPRELADYVFFPHKKHKIPHF
jgi:hypothetical protein